MKTMQVLCNRQQLTFAPAHWNAKTEMNEYEGGGEVSISPKPTIQTVPDWVRETNTFKQAVAAGRIFEVNVVNPTQVSAPAEPPTPQPEVPTKKSKSAKSV